MKAIMDLHTHTIACGHAYSTLAENIEQAQQIGLQFLGLSEHCPAMPGATIEYFFSNYRCVPRQYGDLRLLCGGEANISDDEGGIDLTERELPWMDYVIASMHFQCLKPGSSAYNTRAAVKAMQNPYIKILGHPDDARYPLDYEELVRAAVGEQVVLEVNNSSLHPQSFRKNARENLMVMLEKCEKYRAPIIMGTDSHIRYSIGNFEIAAALLESVGFPEELVLNYDPENMKRVVREGVL